MKKILLTVAVMIGFAGASFGQSDAIEKYFEKYMDDEQFTVVYISPKMFNMISKITPEDMDPEVKDVINNLKGLRILTTETNTSDFYKEAILHKKGEVDNSNGFTFKADAYNIKISDLETDYDKFK